MKYIVAALLTLYVYDVYGLVRIKDIVYFEGIRENMLVGYGLAVGLNSTGDNLRNSGFTQNSLMDYLTRMGVSTTNIPNLNTRNVASVMVTASLPPFARPGNMINVQISTLGDAKSLKGGNLLATPLIGADGQVYALAQGNITVGTPATFDTRIKGTPTSGYIINGAIVEKDIKFNMNSLQEIKLSLKNPDITTARSIATAINSAMQDNLAFPKDPGTITITVPINYINKVVDLLADIENLTITPDTIAKIIIDEASGTIVIGDNVKISKVAVAQGDLVLKVSDQDKLNFLFKDEKEQEPAPGTQLAILEENATLNDLVQSLNSLGIQPNEMIAILKSIQQAGALQAIIEIK
jgi:flagellar P-ring protein precursor FlgI